MKTRLFGAALLLTLGTVSAADYKAGWTPVEFYGEVVTCRSAIMLPAIKSFVDKGIAKKVPEDEVRNTAVSMLPLMEHAATLTCYCAVNETAKTVDYKTYFGTGDFTERTRQLSKAISGPPCEETSRAAMAEMEDEKLRESLRLH